MEGILDMREKYFYRKTFILCGFLLVVFLSCTITNYYFYKQYNEAYNRTLNEMMGLIKTHDTDITAKEIADVLAGKPAEETDKNYFAEYGVNLNEDAIIMSGDSVFHRFILIQSGIVLFCGALFFLGIFLENWKRKKDIEEITNYIEQINRGNYALKIDNNSEDELSILKNEVYKTTIMLKETASQALDDKRLLKESLSDISHQLKTPITSLLVNLENLQDCLAEDAKTEQRMIKNAMRDVGNIKALVEYILKLSKLDANTITFHKKETTLKDLVTAAKENVDALRDLLGIEILETGDGEIPLCCDAYWQTEAITNILKNAIEHANGRVRIQFDSNSVYQSIRIENDGEPMDKEEEKHIFERFYRGKHAKKDSVGIGLALSKAIVEQENGHIMVERLNEREDAPDVFKTAFIIKYSLW